MRANFGRKGRLGFRFPPNKGNRARFWHSFLNVIGKRLPMEKAKREKYRTGQHALTENEYRRVLEVIDNLEDEVLIRFTVASGMRREDVINMEIKNMDLNNGYIQFFEHKKRKIHHIYIPQDVIILIKKYLHTIPKKQEMLFGFSSRTAYNRFQNCLVKAGLYKRPFHALRATCIKFCQLKGWTPQQTAKHVDDTLKTIEGHYTVPSDSEMKELAEKRGFA